MATCCIFCLTTLPSMAFWTVTLVTAGLSGQCTEPGDQWAMAAHLAVSIVYIVNISTSFSKIEYKTCCDGWAPSLWGSKRWISATCWWIYVVLFVYFLWTRRLAGFPQHTTCLDGQSYFGYIGVLGLTGVGLVHLLAVILWKTCRGKQQKTKPSSPLSEKDTVAIQF